jgi:hypothetical protein
VNPLATLRRVLDAVRPHPHRGDLIAAAAVPLTVAVAMINVRFGGTWRDEVLLVMTVLGFLLVFGMGLLAPLEEESPRAYQTVLLIAGLTLLAVMLLRLAEVLGVESPLTASGTVTWMATLLAAAAAYPAWSLRSPICALVEFIAGGIALLAFVDWVFDPKGADTDRWILLLLIVAYIGTHLRWRERRPRHAVHGINAAGIAGVALAVSFVSFASIGLEGAYFNDSQGAPASPQTFSFFPFIALNRPSAGWSLVLVAVGFGLIAYAAVDREPGPGYLGFLVLILFALSAGQPARGGASLIGWPIVLLLIGGAGLATGLRPRRDLPPEPGPPQPPEPPAPLAAEPPTETLPPEPPTREHP